MSAAIRSIVCAASVFFALTSACEADDVAYKYDALGRLIRATYALGQATIYFYDAAGNRTQVVYSGNNSGPTANADSYSTNQNNALAAADPRLNDSDPDSDSLAITAAGPASHGAVAINAGQTVTYTPAAGYSGSDSFPYTISDGNGHTASAVVSLTVVNRPPNAVTDNVATNFNTAKQFNPLSNDVDPDGDTLSVTAIASQPSHGSATRNSGTQVTYTPTSGYSGSDSFTYIASDGHSNTATGTVNITVSAQNQAPTAANDSGSFGSITHGTPVTPIVTLDPRINDADPDGDSLTIASVTNGSGGNVVINGGGSSLTYTYHAAVLNLSTSDSFTYSISDGQGHTATATVTITIVVMPGGQ